jgi:uncharacterized SAM-binding protein YcdF (DUF218 family)
LRKKTLLLISTLTVLFGFTLLSGRALVIDQPARADVIVVLAGETKLRPEFGVELLRRGYAGRLMIDVPANAVIYQHTQMEIAQAYIGQLPEAPAVRLCPIYGLSTKDESHDVFRCLQNSGVRKVLLVTSDYHTRRALSIFRKMLPNYDFEVAAVSDPKIFGVNWWQHREWAKTAVAEWAKLIWWEAVDRW